MRIFHALLFELNLIFGWRFSLTILTVGMHPFDCKYTILSFPKMLMALTTCMGRGRGGSVEKEGGRVNRASHYY